ncbi:MAG: hypothetical protein V4555_00810 [Acidobacteriota bacterium]
MAEIVPIDPDLPRQRRTIAGGLIFSAFVIVIVLFSLGDIPMIDAMFASINVALRSRNDLIVSFILGYLPYAVVGASVFGLTYVVLGHFDRQRPVA